jgi:medium-chain acyl-[acyl-carrier-protein] hydrolase
MIDFNLFCIPHAGSSATIYTKWKQQMNASIQVIPVELSGRGQRFDEPLYQTIEDMVEDIYWSIHDQLNERPYAIFGHSMGSLIAFELGRKIQNMNQSPPLVYFFSGKTPPQTKNHDPKISKLNNEAFIKEILELGGTPSGLFENKTMTDIFLPIIRSDYTAVDHYEFGENIEKLNSDFVVLYGEQDESMKGEVGDWKELTHACCDFIPFSGGHFFIHESERSVLNVIERKLQAMKNI